MGADQSLHWISNCCLSHTAESVEPFIDHLALLTTHGVSTDHVRYASRRSVSVICHNLWNPMYTEPLVRLESTLAYAPRKYSFRGWCSADWIN